ncbi:MAG: transglycosylase SLT domain-containing protein [Nannocystaceae bacterium]|nr:transglycosylase SLT domain-containing protein [Nannocystaceae bacterium]
MIRATNARKFACLAILSPVFVIGIGCSSFQFGKHPSLPGAGASATEASSAPTPAFNTPERQRIALVQPWVDSAAYDYELEPQLLNAMIWVESRFVERATSPAGAQGLMQLMPPTAKELAQKLGRPRASSFDPEFNITAGALYIRKMLDRYDGDLELALAAYNAGPGNVDKWTRHGANLPPRSLEYVQLVLNAKRRFEEHHEAILTQTDTMLAKATVPEATALEPKRQQYVPAPPRGAKPKSKPDPAPTPELAPRRVEPTSPPAPSTASKRAGSKPPKNVGKGKLPSVLD